MTGWRCEPCALRLELPRPSLRSPARLAVSDLLPARQVAAAPAAPSGAAARGADATMSASCCAVQTVASRRRGWLRAVSTSAPCMRPATRSGTRRRASPSHELERVGQLAPDHAGQRRCPPPASAADRAAAGARPGSRSTTRSPSLSRIAKCMSSNGEHAAPPGPPPGGSSRRIRFRSRASARRRGGRTRSVETATGG